MSTNTEAALARIVPKRRPPREEESAGLGALLAGPGMGGGAFRMPADISLQKSLVRGGSYLKIEQRPGELIVSNGDTTHTYVAGEESVVSIPNGVADQRSGWKGREYWVELRPEYGPGVTETFRLEQGGKRLVETIDVQGDGRVRRLAVTRVYEPTSEVPSLLPVED